MNDIDLCNGTGCPLKSKCSRFLLSKKLKSNRYAWWVDPCYKNGKCDNLITKKELDVSL
jgi:hypothetical protein